MRRLISFIIVLVAIEAVFYVRWLIFGGLGSSFNWLFPIEVLFMLWAVLWAVVKVADMFEKREELRNSQLRDIATRLEALDKWGSIYSAGEEEEPEDWAQEKEDLDEATKKEVAKCREGVERGEVDLRYNLGVTYWNLGVKHYNAHSIEGYRKAVYWLRKAAKYECNCESTLAEAYVKLKEYDKAILWYRRIVRRGDKLAYIAERNIGDMYAEGQGVLQNYAEAARWWSVAASHGCKFAQYDLGKLYAKGANGVQKDASEAYFHLYIAASGNELSGLHQYVFELRDEVAKKLNQWEISRQQKRAEEWLANQSPRLKLDFDSAKKAAEEAPEDAERQYDLAMHYSTGYGVDKDEHEAARLFQRAKELGWKSPAESIIALYRDSE